MTLKTATPWFEAFPGISDSRAKGRLQLPVPVRAQIPGARPGGYALRVAADMASYDAGVAAGVLSALRAATGPLDKQELADIINGDSALRPNQRDPNPVRVTHKDVNKVLWALHPTGGVVQAEQMNGTRPTWVVGKIPPAAAPQEQEQPQPPRTTLCKDALYYYKRASRSQTAESNPTVGPRELVQIMEAAFAALPDNERRPFEERAAADAAAAEEAAPAEAPTGAGGASAPAEEDSDEEEGRPLAARAKKRARGDPQQAGEGGRGEGGAGGAEGGAGSDSEEGRPLAARRRGAAAGKPPAKANASESVGGGEEEEEEEEYDPGLAVAMARAVLAASKRNDPEGVLSVCGAVAACTRGARRPCAAKPRASRCACRRGRQLRLSVCHAAKGAPRACEAVVITIITRMLFFKGVPRACEAPRRASPLQGAAHSSSPHSRTPLQLR